MFTTWTDTNKYTSTLLQVRYSVEQIRTDDLTYYEVHRYADKSYAYLALTKEAATQCQAAKILQYTRTKKMWEYDEEEEEFVSTDSVQCMAAVRGNPNGSGWEVQIDVSEDDHVLTVVKPDDPAELFADINATRSYDDDEGSTLITVRSASRSESSPTYVTVDYITQLSPGVTDAIVCEYAGSASAASWTAATLAFPTSRVYVIPEISPAFVRLSYQSAVSNVVEVF